ncbi:radical SAM family heme chaperone HemW [Mycetocola zhadangensis]|uniref:Heme chaperone HemW n=1 Tax=Mycetocola zhadangensis TaxID=1164595 RepID=A0A3L7J6K6_9MICO|nr:radical SAM family heme chaperone HemW [Mycetocola zhadangensis]RLQ85995.1 coproporphyrinogen III oxidase [Mycetocola zhadangensis]GGE87489.1 coproporphyrinogen III oxidase [Mycetocola zhadangensis]
MAGPLPLGDPAPPDGMIPASAVDGADSRSLAFYLHVPFCRVRCGYCDFNTYTATELRGAKQSDYADEAAAEVAFAARALQQSGLPHREVETIFFGGGTPTLLPASDLVRMLEAVRAHHGVSPDAEITTEANPDSVDAGYLRQLADAGFTRVSFGMQSAVPRVLATLERTHDPARVPMVVEWAKAAGLQVSVDLIYGTPGETLDDWETSVDAALATQPDHISAYSLIVEQGTKLARQIKSGFVALPDEDLQADMYELIDERLASAGFSWYEVSNWSTSRSSRSRHNLAYWQSQDWWGVGPGAHSHVGGVRWWNVKHPAAYAGRMADGVSPAVGRETLDGDARELERVLLGARTRDGIQIKSLASEARVAVAGLIADDLVNAKAALAGTIELTLRGRLLADVVVRRLTA